MITYRYSSPSRDKIVTALEAALVALKFASHQAQLNKSYSVAEKFDEDFAAVEAALAAMDVEEGDATDDQLRRMVYSDQGDSKIMRLPDGTERLTGYTAEAGSDPGEYTAALRRIYDEWVHR